MHECPKCGADLTKPGAVRAWWHEEVAYPAHVKGETLVVDFSTPGDVVMGADACSCRACGVRLGTAIDTMPLADLLRPGVAVDLLREHTGRQTPPARPYEDCDRPCDVECDRMSCALDADEDDEDYR